MFVLHDKIHRTQYWLVVTILYYILYTLDYISGKISFSGRGPKDGDRRSISSICLSKKGARGHTGFTSSRESFFGVFTSVNVSECCWLLSMNPCSLSLSASLLVSSIARMGSWKFLAGFSLRVLRNERRNVFVSDFRERSADAGRLFKEDFAVRHIVSGWKAGFDWNG